MGKWITSPNIFTSFLGDRIGYKSGLALTRAELANNLDRNDSISEIIKTDSDEFIRINAADIEDAFQLILYRIGVINEPYIGHAPTLLSFEYRNDKVKTNLFNEVMNLLGKVHFDKGKISLSDGFDEKIFFEMVKEDLSTGATDVAESLISKIKKSEEASPWEWLKARQIEWKNKIELEGLFKSESLDAMYGEYFDQRYIDYLASNSERISDIHWRKFEALTAEYFNRKGYKVEIGPGRNDGGVDVRVWNPVEAKTSPPIILIQCKREKNKVGKVVVKSLWADIVNERASSGMIVTSSSLSPGAKEVCTARSYPITETNKETLKLWLKELRTPGKGIFLGL